ncbi:hypothetical protein [Pseudomonas syringae]|uniref:hypothetical protein n=1 Tax=Pseudomonas syringae TaxID=317 RepID=UPI000347A42A|nr:hypothetical protein [Pseudomonas syringae]
MGSEAVPPIFTEDSKIDDRLIGRLHVQAGYVKHYRMEIALPGPTFATATPAQDLQLLGRQLYLRALPRTGPEKLALTQTMAASHSPP